MAFLPGGELGALLVGDVRAFAGGEHAGVADEFLADAEGQHDETAPSAGFVQDDARDLQALDGLAEAEGFE